MRKVYGVWSLLATVFVVGSVSAIDAPAKGTLLSKVRMASVTTVTQTAQPGLSGTVKRVEDYFNGMNTLQASFTQTVTGDVTPSTGTFYWMKPGKFLWLYKEPVPQKLVSTGNAIYFEDDRGQATQLPTNAGVARLFNAKRLNLSEQGLRATHVRDEGRYLTVTFDVMKDMKTSDTAALKELTLSFIKLPRNRLQLSRMEALDSIGVTTEVAFRDVKENVQLVRSLFTYTPGVYNQRN